MRLFRSKSIVVLLALTLVLMFASTAAALPAAGSSVKTGFYVYDASKAAGQEYSYYSMPYVLDPAHFATFLAYKDGFADNSKFIWVNSAEQFVSIADWANGPADITDIVTDLGTATYYDVENGTPINLALGVEATISSPSKTGFSLALSREVAGLDDGDVMINGSSVGVAVNNTGDDINFDITCSLTPGETYTLTIAKVGFDFGEAISFEVPTEVINVAAIAVTGQDKTGFTLNLSTALDGITFAGNFKLQDQYGNEVSITSATSTDGGNKYVFATGTMIRERTYTLTSINDRYALSAPVSFTIAPVQVTATIQNVTVNDLVVKLSPGVDNIPSANFYLKDSSNNRLLTMILSKTGSPTTDYTIGAFPYLTAGAQYSIGISMPEYDFGEAKSVSPGQTPVTMTVSGTPTTSGFAVTMSPAVPGLTTSNFSLKNSQNASVPFSVTTTNGGATYNIKADIIAGSGYTIAAVKNGYNFGTAQNVLAPVVMVGGGAVNGSVYVYLNGVLAAVPAAGDFTITRSIGGVAQPNVTPTAVSQNTTTRMLTLTVPQIAATGADQAVTGTVSYAGVTKNYTFTVPSSPAPVAAGITSIPTPAQDVTTLTLPTVPAGFTVAIKSSSNSAVIATDGKITLPTADTTVNLVLTVTKTSGGATADTISLPVTVLSSPIAIAAAITTIPQPAVSATQITLPTVPTGYTVAIKSSSNTALVSLTGAITPPESNQTVNLVLTVTKTGATSADTASIAVIIPGSPVPVANAITSITAPVTNATSLTLPTVPSGYSIAIQSSSNTAVVALNGTITPPSTDTTVNLVLRITNTVGGAHADTVSIPVVIPASPIPIAAGIKSVTAPALNATSLTLPTVPTGFTIAIKSSSNIGVIATNGTVTPPATDTTIALVLTVTKTSGSYTADTASINVVVPGSPNVVAAGITSITAPAKDATTLTLPSVPSGFTIAIKSSSNTAVIATNGKITPPTVETTVALVLTVTKTVGGATADTISMNVVVPVKTPTAAEIAATITSITAPAKDATALTLPTVPSGFTIAIKTSSNTAVIATSGVITPPAAQTTVALVLEVTRTSDSSKASTGSINVVVPAKTPTAAEIAATITSIAAPAKDATQLTLPTVQSGYTIAIKSSSNTAVIALDGKITPPAAETTVALVLEVTRTSDSSKASTGSINVVVPQRSPGPNGTYVIADVVTGTTKSFTITALNSFSSAQFYRVFLVMGTDEAEVTDTAYGTNAIPVTSKLTQASFYFGTDFIPTWKIKFYNDQAGLEASYVGSATLDGNGNLIITPLLTVASVKAISDINVANGTAKESIGLPTQVQVTLSNETNINVEVTWNNGTPAYNGDQAGTYVFAGTLSNFPANVVNTGSVKAQVNVIVAAPIPPAGKYVIADVVAGTTKSFTISELNNFSSAKYYRVFLVMGTDEAEVTDTAYGINAIPVASKLTQASFYFGTDFIPTWKIKFYNAEAGLEANYVGAATLDGSGNLVITKI